MSPGTTSEPAQPAVRVANASKAFVSPAGSHLALQAVDLSVAAGRFVSIVGPSGCGKSTLLRLVSGLYPPTQGTIALFGHSPQRFRREGRIGFVFQDATLLPWRTAMGNVVFPLGIMKLGDRDRRGATAKRFLELVGLGDRTGAYPSQLSGGMRQRVSIARALACEPRLLLMDEPFGALDEFTRHDLNEELDRICAATGQTTLFVTHSLAEALFLADEVVVMAANPGRVIGIMPVRLPRPRTYGLRSAPEFAAQLAELEAIFRARG